VEFHQVGREIWVYEGTVVNLYGFPFSTRMTVVRLGNGALWVHSPEKLSDELQKELSELGEVKYLVSPNKLHHLFLQEWIAAYPQALKFAAPGLALKRNDIAFDRELCNSPEDEWKEEIAQTIFRGSPAMEEVVFYHRLSKTLVLTDLIENIRPESLNWWQRRLARLAGILYPTGRMPIDWRLTYLFGSKEKARASLHTILAWDVENIILSHGECIFGDGNAFMKQSFSWLNASLTNGSGQHSTG
jgi:Domain of unknown function (DUF4336)